MTARTPREVAAGMLYGTYWLGERVVTGAELLDAVEAAARTAGYTAGLRGGADYVRDRVWVDGLTVQEAILSLRHHADSLATAGQAPAPQPETAPMLHFTPTVIGMAHNMPQPETAPDAEPGTPDTVRELASLSVNAANALRDERRHHKIAAREVARLRNELAVRDDALTTAQRRERALRTEVQRQVDAKISIAGQWGNALADLKAAEQRITAALDHHPRRDDTDGPYCGAGCGDWPCTTVTALTPANPPHTTGGTA